jgi:antitoxin (DNA-binding transcriptional repressor) of toxin-antitoxin stability system
MRTISAVDLRNDLEGIVKSLKRGERLELTYRGEMVGQLLPAAHSRKSNADAAIERLARSHLNDPDYTQKADHYLQEVYADRRSYGSRSVAE